MGDEGSLKTLIRQSGSLKKCAVGGGFLFQSQRVGAGGGGQAGECQFAAGVGKGDGFAGFGRGGFLRQHRYQYFRRFAAGGADGAAVGHLCEHGFQIDQFHRREKLVGSVVALAHGFEHGGAGCDAALVQKGFDFVGIEGLFRLLLEMGGIVEKY